MIFIGDDWAEDHHDIDLMDETGARLTSRRLPEGLAGIGEFHQLLARHADYAGQVVIGIATDRGLWITALVAASYSGVCHQPDGSRPLPRPPPPLGSQVGRRRRQAPGQSLVGTDRHNHRRVARDSADAEAVKVLARSQQNLIGTRNQHTNKLHAYYPGALVAFDDLHDRDACAILGRAPTPVQAASLSLARIRGALKAAGCQRNLDARAQDIQAALRVEQLTAPAAVTAAFAATTRAMVGIIAELNRQITETRD